MSKAVSTLTLLELGESLMQSDCEGQLPRPTHAHAGFPASALHLAGSRLLSLGCVGQRRPSNAPDGGIVPMLT